jgi:hypothetical protein
MDKPPPDPVKLLGYWEEWERGETTPGRVMANLKTAGMAHLPVDPDDPTGAANHVVRVGTGDHSALPGPG